MSKCFTSDFYGCRFFTTLLADTYGISSSKVLMNTPVLVIKTYTILDCSILLF